MSSNAQNSHSQSIILQSQSMDIDTNIEQHHAVAIPLQQTSQQPSTTQIQILESSKPELIKSVQSILNEISPYNISLLTKRFKALPIDNIYCLEKTVDLVFEKAIEDKWFAPPCSYLCSAMQTVQVSSKDGKTVSFKKLLIQKCQNVYELGKAKEMDSDKKLTEINLCKDPEKIKELQLEFEENKRRFYKRSVGNCRFIGELFKLKFLTANIMLYCIVDLVTNHDEESLKCLCILLKTAGKELEQLYDLNDTFDKLKALTSRDMKFKIPSRIIFMIQDVIDLRRDKWIPRRGNKNECYVVPNNTKYKQQNFTIGLNKLAGFKGSTFATTTLSPPTWSFTTGKNAFTSSNPYAILNDDEKSSNSSQIM